MDGPRLQLWRKALGLSQGQLAQRLGLDPATLSRWERGVQRIAHPLMLRHALSWLQCERDAEQLRRESEGDQR